MQIEQCPNAFPLYQKKWGEWDTGVKEIDVDQTAEPRVSRVRALSKSWGAWDARVNKIDMDPIVSEPVSALHQTHEVCGTPG